MDDNYIRLAKGLQKAKGNKIIDRETFQVELSDYLQTDIDKTGSNQTWDAYRTMNNLEDKSIHKEEGGKSLKKDRERKSKNVVTRRQDYKNAQKQDLQGYDTKTTRGIEKISTKSRRDYNFKGLQKSKVVNARKIFVTVKGKRQTRYIGYKGRYVSVKK